MNPDHDTVQGAAALPPPLEGLLSRFTGGDRSALARAISVVENERTGFQPFLDALLRVTSGGGARAGITGPPGAGKSTLVAALAQACRDRDEEVGVVAVDPTSPFSGGALLGDRIRMNDIAMDRGIFIRSMASRGSLGGLATTTSEVLDVMDAFGFPRLLVETVGVGQAELEIAGSADTVVVVLVPESGDGIQAMKAGLMEIADVFVVNKADRPGADRLVKEIRLSLQLRQGQAMGNVPAHHGVDLSRLQAGERSRTEGAESGKAPDSGHGKGAETKEKWTVPIVKTVAQSGEGVPELVEALDAHREYLARSGELDARRRERARTRIRNVVERELRRTARRHLAESETLEAGLAGIREGTATPYTVAARILEELGVTGERIRLPRGDAQEVGS